MDHTAAAIREAADEAATVTVWWKVHDIEDSVGSKRSLNEQLYDRAFWEALGKHETGRMQAA